jgi:hypothetical protein
MEKTPKFNKHRAFHKAVEPGKNTKLISIGPTFINFRFLSRLYSLMKGLTFIN